MPPPFLLLVLAALVPGAVAGDPGGAAPMDGSFGSGGLATGETHTHTFTEAGEAGYYCHPHPWMVGTVVVAPSNGSEPRTHHVRIVEPDDIEDWRFEPARIQIQTGDSVVWTNEGLANHTVTSDDATDGHGHDHSTMHAPPGDDAATPVPPWLTFVAAAVVALARPRRAR